MPGPLVEHSGWGKQWHWDGYTHSISEKMWENLLLCHGFSQSISRCMDVSGQFPIKFEDFVRQICDSTIAGRDPSGLKNRWFTQPEIRAKTFHQLALSWKQGLDDVYEFNRDTGIETCERLNAHTHIYIIILLHPAPKNISFTWTWSLV